MALNDTSTPAAKPSTVDTKGERVLTQIEGAADYYAPFIYSSLGFYSNFTPNPDNLSNDFIPVTGVKPNPKLFVVGVIPPAANVTGRLLDRSGSVSSVLGAPEDIQLEEAKQGGPPGVKPGAPSGGGVPSVAATPGNGTKGASLPPSFWDEYVKMCNRLQCDPFAMAAIIQNESGFDPAAQNFAAGKDKPPVAQGLHQMIHSTARNYMSEDDWKNLPNTSAEYQLQFIEKSFKGRAKGKTATQLYGMNLGGYPNPDGSAYASKAAQAEWIAAHPEDAGKFKNPDYQDLAIKQNPGIGNGKTIFVSDLTKFVEGKPSPSIRAQIDAAIARVGGSVASSEAPGGNTETGSKDWKDKGSPNAGKAKEDQFKTADNELAKKQAELGAKFLAAQQAEINATVQALDTMRNTPPLRLLVNPASFKVSSEKIISDGNWTRNGPIIEHWGDNQDKLEGSGRVAGFFAIDANSPFIDQGLETDGEGPGLTRVARNFTAAYQNLLSLWLLYRSNAGLYTKGLDGTEWARLSMVGSIYIFYDNVLYLGSFDSFNLTETDDKPYSMEYNFQFTVRATFLLDRPDNPGQDYGAKSFTSGDPNIPTDAQAFENKLLSDQPVVPAPESPGGLTSEEAAKQLGFKPVTPDGQANKVVYGSGFGGGPQDRIPK